MALQTTQASDQAKAAVAQNGQLLQRKLAERQKLLTQLEQAKMQEQMNKAMATLSETVGEDVPTIDEVRDKIEPRYAKAKGMAELQGESVEGRMLEVEQAAQNTEAQARLSQIRAQLGLAPAEAEAPPAAAAAPAAPAPSPGPGPGPGAGARRLTHQPRFCVAIGRPQRRPIATQNRRSYGQEDEVVAVDDLGGRALGELRAALPGGRGHHRGAHPHQALGEHLAVGAGHLDRVVRREGAADLDHAGRQQRRARPPRAPGGRPRRRPPDPAEPTANAIQSLRAGSRRSRGSTTVPTPGTPVDRAPRARRRGAAAAITVRTPDQAAILAAASFEAMPPLPRTDPAPPARASSSWSTSTISSISDADESSRGSAVSSPAVSVSSTSRSASTRWATRAARRSLSPKRISSSAMASFSLTTGTTPSSSRRCSVARAWRYCWRTTKSSGASSTWPATRPCSASTRS